MDQLESRHAILYHPPGWISSTSCQGMNMSQAGNRTKSGPGWLAALGGPLLIVTALAMIIGLVSPADDDGKRTAG